MPDETEEWPARFVSEKLKGYNEVRSIKPLTPQILNIERKANPAFQLGTIALERVEPAAIMPFLTGGYEIEFIVNVPRESFWTGEAIKLVTNSSIAFHSRAFVITSTRSSSLSSAGSVNTAVYKSWNACMTGFTRYKEKGLDL